MTIAKRWRRVQAFVPGQGWVVAYQYKPQAGGVPTVSATAKGILTEETFLLSHEDVALHHELLLRAWRQHLHLAAHPLCDPVEELDTAALLNDETLLDSWPEVPPATTKPQ